MCFAGQALELYQQGYNSIEKLRCAVNAGNLTLTREQHIGLDCYEDILEDMARDEVKSLGKIIIEAYHCISPVQAEATIMGSYRRGNACSGDVDVLITMKDFPETIPRDALSNLIEFLTEQGHIAHNITQLAGVSATGRFNAKREQSIRRQRLTKAPRSYMGVFFSPKFPGKLRRVDIKIYPYNQKAFASLCK